MDEPEQVRKILSSDGASHAPTTLGCQQDTQESVREEKDEHIIAHDETTQTYLPDAFMFKDSRRDCCALVEPKRDVQEEDRRTLDGW